MWNDELARGVLDRSRVSDTNRIELEFAALVSALQLEAGTPCLKLRVLPYG